MKIAFNVSNSGLGNNGGSRTILLCQKTLENLGHTCDVVGTVDNFTWFDHKPIINYMPHDLTAVIATACTTVTATMTCDVPVKAWYIRGHETWTMSEENLIKLYKAQLLNLVNSVGLQKQLESYGVQSEVIYQGVDTSFWKNKNTRSGNKIRIGCLYNKKPTKRWDDFTKLANILGKEKYEYIGVGDERRKDDFLAGYWTNATSEELNNIYSSCHIWFAPTIQEGLHNMPLEAALCGCLIVCSDHPLNGMVHDYAFDGETAMVYEFDNIEQATELIRNPNWSLTSKMQRYIKNVIGTRENNMSKLVKYLEYLS